MYSSPFSLVNTFTFQWFGNPVRSSNSNKVSRLQDHVSTVSEYL